MENNEGISDHLAISKESEERVDAKVHAYYRQERNEVSAGADFDLAVKRIKAAKEVFLEELEEQGTDPRVKIGGYETEELNEILESGRSSHDAPTRIWEGLLVRIGQQFRLTPDEIDLLRKEIYPTTEN